MNHLRSTGARRLVVELQGVLFFGNVETLRSQVNCAMDNADCIAIDFRRVTDIDVSGANVIRILCERAAKLRRQLILCGLASAILDRLETVGALASPAVRLASDLEAALELMEQQSLDGLGPAGGDAVRIELAQVDIVRGLDEADLVRLERLMLKRCFPAGEVLCREGEVGNSMWLILSGSVSVWRVDASGQRHRIVSLGHGTTVGEMALIEANRRSADIVADQAVDCYELSRDAYDSILRSEPAMGAKLLANVARESVRRLRHTSADLLRIRSAEFGVG